MSQNFSRDPDIHVRTNCLENLPQQEREHMLVRSQEGLYQLYLAAIIESSDEAILGKTLDGIITSWNPAAERLYGYTAQEIVGKPIATIVPDELRGDLARILQCIKDGQKIDHHETIRVCKNGRRVNVSVTISPIKEASGKVIGASTIARDITAQKKAEERARFLNDVSKVLASSLDYQTTLAHIAQLVVPQLADWFAVDLVDAEGHFNLIEVGHKDPTKVEWAKALRKCYPVDPHALSGAPQVVRTRKAELYPVITEAMLVASAKTEEQLTLYHQVGLNSIMIVPLLARNKALGALTFILSNLDRIYDREDLAFAEEMGYRIGIALDNAILYRQAQQSRDELYAILQNVADGITVQDKNGTLIYANDIAARLCGFSSAAAMVSEAGSNRQLSDVLCKVEMRDELGNFLPHDQLPGRQALQGQKNAQAFVQYYDSVTSQTRWSLVKAEPIFDEYGQVQFAVNVITDISEERAFEQRKDEFIRMASHELKTPITALKGFTALLQRRMIKQGDESNLSFVGRMDTQLNKLTKLISDLLDVSKMQVGKLDYQEELFDLDALAQETVEILQETTQTHHLQFEGQANVQVFGDRDRIGQVLINLLTNAIKYSPQANKVMIQVSTSQEQAILSVQDFGIGIGDCHQTRIFERFYQITESEAKTYPGLGIGLYISKEIVMRHHGQIWIESRKGEGTTFYVSLPLQNEEK